MAPTGRPPLVPSGFPRRALCALLLAALVLRVGTSLSRVDECFAEGLVRGALTQAWIEGAPVWPSEAPQLPHIRGSVVMSAIAWPAFQVLGPTTFAVRLGGILFHLAGLATLMLLVHRLFGARAAALSGALWVFCPPALAKIAVLSYGDHIESLPFVFATAWLALSWCEDRSGRRAGVAFATGVVAGLGFGFHAQARLGVAAVALLCALLDPGKALRRDFWVGLVP
ncbi:MAG TPA: glycosyltransferase family 39 protein, partial [Planctomycetota bacterium]|nr:glycosyltransferase family 39 protein [Planctomycetota bacterium]